MDVAPTTKQPFSFSGLPNETALFVLRATQRNSPFQGYPTKQPFSGLPHISKIYAIDQHVVEQSITHFPKDASTAFGYPPHVYTDNELIL